jgi:hypothetical protein
VMKCRVGGACPRPEMELTHDRPELHGVCIEREALREVELVYLSAPYYRRVT